MIVDLPATSVSAVSKKLLALREDVGAMALSRVLTLIAVTDDAHVEETLEVASAATRQHPSRIVVVVSSNRRGASRLDGQIRLGGDAGASEVVVLRLYGELAGHGDSVVLPLLLADSPIVAWFPYSTPKSPSTDPIGRLAQRRITDSEHAPDPSRNIHALAKVYAGGDSDMVWTRTTKWRGVLAAALDLPPYESVTSAAVTGGLDSASTDLLAAWLAAYLGCPVTRVRTPANTGLVSVRLERPSGNVDLVRPDGLVATLAQPGQPTRRLALARRHDAECLSDELTRLDPDEVYERVLVKGLPLCTKRTMPAHEAVEKGIAPSAEEARQVARTVARQTSGRGSATMVSMEPPSEEASAEAVQAKVEQKREQLDG